VSGAPSADVTGLLQAWGRGDSKAGEELATMIYSDLRRLAARKLRRETPAHTLSPTALVHETYLRLVDQRRAAWQNRKQFFAVAARIMRRVLVDHAREKRAAKRGGSWCRVSFDDAQAAGEPRDVDFLALEEALDQLAERDPDKVRMIELRFFGGLSLDETAEVLGVSAATVTREWRMARAWLFRRLRAGHERVAAGGGQSP
jgi:RNA polymerase sigma factor (TIGR02999 family)